MPCPLGIDRLRAAVDDVLVEGVLDVGRLAFAPPKSRAAFVSFSVKSNSGCVPSASGPAARRKRPRVTCSASSVPSSPRWISGFGQQPLVGAAPRPGVAEPERRQQMQDRAPPARGWPR